MKDYANAAEQIGLFCRIHVNAKKNIPIRSSEMGMLIYLVKTDGEKTPMAAARFFKFTKSMATNMVSSLVRKGYIRKEQSEKDRRSFFILPTEKAVALVEETYAEYIKTIILLNEKMGDCDFNVLIEMLEKANSFLLEEKNI